MMQVKKEQVEIIIFREKIKKKFCLNDEISSSVSEEKKMIYIPSVNLVFCPDGFDGMPIVMVVRKNYNILTRNIIEKKNVSSEIVESIVMYEITLRKLSNPLFKKLLGLE